MHLPEGPQAALELGWPIRVTLTWRPRVGLCFCSSIRTLHGLFMLGSSLQLGDRTLGQQFPAARGNFQRRKEVPETWVGGDECLGPEGDRGGLLHYSL